MARSPPLAPDALTTPRLQLRCLQQADAPQLRDAFLRSRDDLEEQTEPVDTLEAASAAIARYAALFEGARSHGPASLVYGLFDPGSRELVGCGAIEPAQPRAFNLAVWIDAAARGRGHATAAIATLTAAAFRWLGAGRTEIWCDRTNHGMVRIAERVGYTHEVTLRRWSLPSAGDQRDQMIWRFDADAYPTSNLVELAISTDEPRPRASRSEEAWARLAAHLVATHAVVREGDQSCELAVEVVFDSGRRHLQPVIVEQGDVGGGPWLIVRALVGPDDLLSVHTALQHSATLAAGALTLENGHYVLRHGAAADEITPRGVNRIVWFLAREAARLREGEGVGVEAQVQAFAGYID